jgi:hypothetical protein
MGKTRNVNEWSRILGMSPATITARINYGWPVDKVLNSKTIRQKELPMNISYYSNRYQVQIGNEYIGKYLTLEEATAALKTFGGDKKHYEVLTGYVDRRGDFIEVGRIIHSKRKPIEHHFIASLLEHNFIREVEADAEQVDALSTMLGGNPLDNFPNIRKEEQ